MSINTNKTYKQQSTLTSTTNLRGSTTTPLKCWRSFFLNFKSPCINPMTLSKDRCPIGLEQLL